MLRSEVIAFEQLSGENAELTSISRIGGFLDGYQKAMEKQQWIPCSERLPDGEQHLLVSVHDNSEFITIDTWTGTNFWTFGHHVIAWMPLPEPYKGDSK